MKVDIRDVIEAIEFEGELLTHYYNKKTALKGDDTEDGIYMYTKSKNMLNSVY